MSSTPRKTWRARLDVITGVGELVPVIGDARPSHVVDQALRAFDRVRRPVSRPRPAPTFREDVQRIRERSRPPADPGRPPGDPPIILSDEREGPRPSTIRDESWMRKGSGSQSDGTVVVPAKKSESEGSDDNLEAENARLRAELEALRSQSSEGSTVTEPQALLTLPEGDDEPAALVPIPEGDDGAFSFPGDGFAAPPS